MVNSNVLRALYGGAAGRVMSDVSRARNYLAKGERERASGALISARIEMRGFERDVRDYGVNNSQLPNLTFGLRKHVSRVKNLLKITGVAA